MRHSSLASVPWLSCGQPVRQASVLDILRRPESFGLTEPFDLVTMTPPYEEAGAPLTGARAAPPCHSSRGDPDPLSARPRVAGCAHSSLSALAAPRLVAGRVRGADGSAGHLSASH